MRRLIALAALALLELTSPWMARAIERPLITVVSQNLYLGTDLAAIFAATDLSSAIDAGSAAFAAVQASNPAARMQAVADELAKKRPDLIGLQEAGLWRSGAPGTEPTTIEFDFVALLIDALARHGLAYAAVATITNVDVQFPARRGVEILEMRHTDRDVILARTDSALQISNVQSANFETNAVIPVPVIGTFTVRRGWVSVDATLGGTTFRFVNTHLESVSPVVQLLQALEILSGPADTTLPVVLVCDCNSSASGEGPDATPTYAALLESGFTDAWSEKHPGADGFTCCQAADLRNLPSALIERIDFVLFRGDFDVRHAALLGAAPGDRTKKPARLWPSDHAGVAATLELR